MNFIAEDVKDILVAEGFGSFGGSADWSIYIDNEPKEPTNCITVFTVFGDYPEFSYNRIAEPAIDNSGIQLKIRGVDKKETFTKIYDIVRMLEKKPPIFLSDKKILSFIRDTDILDLSYDQTSEVNSYAWVVSFNVKNIKKDS